MRRVGPRHASGEDLVAYADGYLAGRRREIVEEHLRACPRCRDRLRGFAEVARIVNRGAPLVDDPRRRAALHARLAAEGRRVAPMRRWSSDRILVAAASLVLAVALLASPLASEAGFPFGRFLRFGPVRVERNQGEGQALKEVAPPSAETDSLLFASVEPDRLPLALNRVSRSLSESGRLEMLYRSPAGLAVIFTQVPADESTVKLESFGRQEVVSVRDTPILQLAGIRPDAVAGLLWEREGVRFELLVTEAPPGGLERVDALQIAEAVLAAQDVGEG